MVDSQWSIVNSAVEHADALVLVRGEFSLRGPRATGQQSTEP